MDETTLRPEPSGAPPPLSPEESRLLELRRQMSYLGPVSLIRQAALAEEIRRLETALATPAPFPQTPPKAPPKKEPGGPQHPTTQTLRTHPHR